MTVGAGTELKRLLARIGIHSTPECLCDQRAMIMDEEGPDWCRQNMGIIVGWMREEAESRRMPFNDVMAKMLIMRAICNARKKTRILQDD